MADKLHKTPFGEARLLFMEDDACLHHNFEEHGHESAKHAWARLFPDRPWVQPSQDDETTFCRFHDGGDYTAFLLKGGIVYEDAFDGESLYQLKES